MKSKEGSVSLPSDTIKRKPDEPSENSSDDLLELAAQELFEAKTPKARAEALRAIFQILENEPHEEIEHG